MLRRSPTFRSLPTYLLGPNSGPKFGPPGGETNAQKEKARKVGEKLRRKKREDENAYVRRIALQSRAVLVLYEIVVGAITCYALADLMFGLNQGYSWNDVLLGGGMMVFGVALYLAGQGIFRFVADNY